jgi:hypothetical protein
LAFFAQTTASTCKKIDHNIGCWENANFFAENWQKSQKIVIKTSIQFGRPEAGLLRPNLLPP